MIKTYLLLFLILFLATPQVGFGNSCPNLLQSVLMGTADGDQSDAPLKIISNNLKINSARDLSEMVKRVKEKSIPNRTYAQGHPEKAYVEIIQIGNLKHAYLAIFNHRIYMNWALGRVALFQTQEKLISDQSLTRKNSEVQDFAGHDIPAFVARDFINSYLEQDLLENNDSLKLNIERTFWQKTVLPLIQKDPQATIIAASLDYQPGKILSHELLHAHFYEKPELQVKIEQFWQERVGALDKKQYLKILKKEKYNILDHQLVINEFLAYTLEEGPAMIFPQTLITRYQKDLKEYLGAAGQDISTLVDPQVKEGPNLGVWRFSL